MMDYYQILDVPTHATQDEIKRSYRNKARLYHPDKNQQRKEWAEKMFKDVQLAYNTLSDETKRRVYNDECLRDMSQAAFQPGSTISTRMTSVYDKESGQYKTTVTTVRQGNDKQSGVVYASHNFSFSSHQAPTLNWPHFSAFKPFPYTTHEGSFWYGAL